MDKHLQAMHYTSIKTFTFKSLYRAYKTLLVLTISNYTNMLCPLLMKSQGIIPCGVLTGFKNHLYISDIEQEYWSDLSSQRSTSHSSSCVSMGL